MTKKEWIKSIKSDCEKVGTYKEAFDSVIETLAQILETRDIVHQQFVDEGSQATITKTTDRSAVENTYKNPLLVLETDLNSQALKYFSELGLTSKSLKQIQSTLNTEPNESLNSLISKLGG